MTSPLVYISLVNWNGATKTLKCVQDLRRLNYENARIFVIDNASRPEDFARLLENQSEFTLIRADSNDGYAAGHRLTVDRALADGADFVWILNNDLRVPPDTLDKLIDGSRQHEGDLIGGAPIDQAPSESAVIQIHRKYLTTAFRQSLFDRRPFVAHQDFARAHGTMVPVSGLGGSCLLLPVKTVREHGFMDEKYFMYFEEIDYLFRLARHGVGAWLRTDAVVSHEREGSSSGRSRRVGDMIQYYRIRNQLLFIRMHGTRWDEVRAQIKNLGLVLESVLRLRLYRAAFLLRGARDGRLGVCGKTYEPETALQAQ